MKRYTRLNCTKYQALRRLRGLSHLQLAGVNTSRAKMEKGSAEIRRWDTYKGWVFDGKGVPPDKLASLAEKLQCDISDIALEEDINIKREMLAAIDEAWTAYRFGDADNLSDVNAAIRNAAPYWHAKIKDELLAESSKQEQEELRKVLKGIFSEDGDDEQEEEEA